jgi:hypothetical protein
VKSLEQQLAEAQNKYRSFQDRYEQSQLDVQRLEAQLAQQKASKPKE